MELQQFRVKITAAANETFEAWWERDHDDLVLALAARYARRWIGKGKLTSGRWHDFAVHVLWSRDFDKGFVEVWFDGELVVPRAKTATLLDENVAFFSDRSHARHDRNSGDNHHRPRC